MHISMDLDVIRYNEQQFIIYAPLRRVALLVNKDAAEAINFLRAHPEYQISDNSSEGMRTLVTLLKENNLIDPTEIDNLPIQPVGEFNPTSAYLLPTFDCNLRCVYCYASSGEIAATRMDWKVAKAAVDLVCENAIKLGKNKIEVTFHGGGEPTLAWPILTRVVGYAQELADRNGLLLHTGTITNGVLSNRQREWIVKNLSSAAVSCDGPADIHNVQRPMRGGKGSFEHVKETIQFFEAHGFSYDILTVITSSSVTRMIEILDFFSTISSSRHFHFEPLYECGRCRYNGWKAPEPDVFATEFVRAWKYAVSRSINLSTSLARLEYLGSTFCGAAGNNFIVTPDGNITTCLEVSTLIDNRADLFIYGRYDHEMRSFVVDVEKLKYLALRNIHNMPACAACPIKWHCSGDCLVKALDQGDMFDPSQTGRCYSAQRISIEQLWSMLAEPELGHRRFLPAYNLIY